MPVLANAKHERFAQLVFEGQGQAEAYVTAGYSPSEPNASRLRSSDKVSARIAELQQRSATRSEISVASITDRLLAIATKGEASGEAALLAVARASLMDAAKLNGLVVDKSEAKVAATVGVDIDRPPRETREEWLARKAREAA